MSDAGLCKRGDLLNLSPDGFEEEWWKVCRGASAALTMLKGECGVLGRKWLPYTVLFPSLFALATKVLDLPGPAEGAGWEKLRCAIQRESYRITGILSACCARKMTSPPSRRAPER